MVRLANFKDLKSIIFLGSIIDPNFNKLFDLRKALKDKYTKIFVYEKESEIVGFLHITKLYETVEIINLAVLEAYRHQKIASNLIDYMMSEMVGESIKFILEVNVNNLAAINLYEKFGFKIANLRKHYYANEDAYLMIKGGEEE